MAHGPQIGAIYIMHLFTHAQNTEDLDRLESHALFSCGHIIDVENLFIKSLLCFVCGHICSGKKFDYKPEDRKMGRCHVCFNGCSSKLVELIYGFLYSPTVHMPRTLLRKKSVHSPP